MGVKVTLRRNNGAGSTHIQYGRETLIFDEANEWNFSDINTLLLMDNSGEEGRFIAEFPVDVVESVEFV